MYSLRCLTNVAWSSKPHKDPLTSASGIIKTLIFIYYIKKKKKLFPSLIKKCWLPVKVISTFKFSKRA